jgi:hypothetical protein
MLSHRKTTLSLSLAFSVVSTAAAGPVGVFTTNTFGFSGTVTEYASQADFDSDQNGTDSPISFRPVDIFINNGVAGFSSSLYDPTYANVILASDLVLYDVDSSTDTSIGFSFVETVSGSYDITLNLAGSNSDWNNDLSTLPTVPAPAAWPPTETRSFLDYSLDVTALGVGGTLYPQGLFSDSNPAVSRGAFVAPFTAPAQPALARPSIALISTWQ